MRVAPALLAALVLAGCGTDADEAAAPEPVTATVVETPLRALTDTAVPEPQGECSTAGLRTTLPEQDLPPAVAEARGAIVDGALICDYDYMEQLALFLGGDGFRFSYGEEPSAADYWRGLEENGTDEPMRALVTILSLPHTRNESGSYVWPSAYDESATDADWQAVVDAGLYGQDEIDRMKEQGKGYLGWRTAITADGDWPFFVTGD